MNQFETLDELFFKKRTFHIYFHAGSTRTYDKRYNVFDFAQPQLYESIRDYEAGSGFLDEYYAYA